MSRPAGTDPNPASSPAATSPGSPGSSPAATSPGLGFPALTVLAGALVLGALPVIFLRAPEAQLAAGGAAQRIFYFHVPSAWGLYLAATFCGVASGMYLYRPTEARNAWARAGAEVASLFGAMVLATGPLWARKAWGVWWNWEPRLTTLLLSVLVYMSIVLLRAFVGNGEAERKFAAAIGVLGTINLPIIHLAVRTWGGNHPTVVNRGGGGLRHPDMQLAFTLGSLALITLALVLVWQRARLHLAAARLDALEERALAAGLTPES